MSRKKINFNKIPLRLKLVAFILIGNGVSIFFATLLALFNIEYGFFLIEKGLLDTWTILIAVGMIFLGWNLLKLSEVIRKLLLVVLSIFICLAFLALAGGQKGILRTLIEGGLIAFMLHSLTRSDLRKYFQ
jgi:hypothetical protein